MRFVAFFNVNFSNTFDYHFQNFIKVVIIITELSNLVFKLIRQWGIQISSHIKCKMCSEEVVVPYTTSTHFINNIWCHYKHGHISKGIGPTALKLHWFILYICAIRDVFCLLWILWFFEMVFIRSTIDVDIACEIHDADV